MTTAHKITVALAVALAIVLAFAAYGWVTEHEAHAVLQAQQADAKAAVESTEAKEKANQAALAQQLQSFAQMKAQVQTPQQVVRELPVVMPSMPAPIVQVTPAQAKAVDDAKLPDAPAINAGDLVIPASDAKAFYDSQVDCKANVAKVASCQQTVANQQAELATKDAVIKDQDVALKGGTKWQRTRRAGMWALVGGAVVYAASHIHGK